MTSFYPQVIMNYQRKSTLGLSCDMILYDCIGYIALSIYSIGMYADPYIREQYRDTHSGNDPSVAINDVFFATHGILLTLVPLLQMGYYDGYKQTPTRLCMYNLTIIMFLVVGYLVVILTSVVESSMFTLYYWVYSLAFVKLGVTILKYIPQIYLNFVRQSTEGWNITQILLDLMGGLFSALQLGECVCVCVCVGVCVCVCM
jgi:cystinosin